MLAGVVEAGGRARVSEADRAVAPLPRGERIGGRAPCPLGEQPAHRRHERVFDVVHARDLRGELGRARPSTRL